MTVRTHEVVVLGGGYAGVKAAMRLRSLVDPDRVRVTLVNGEGHFVQRIRRHQEAVGQPVAKPSLPAMLEPRGVSFVKGWGLCVDPDNSCIDISASPRDFALPYDTLVYTVGSATRTDCPGVTKYAHLLDAPSSAKKLHDALRTTHHGAAVVVCGGGLTGVESATEIAESFPHLDVTIVSHSEPGVALSTRGQSHLQRTFARLGISVRSEDAVVAVDDKDVFLASGDRLHGDVIVWCASFAVPRLAAQSGLATDSAGRLSVDATLRSTSHPNVFAAGDAAAVYGRQFRMACATALPLGAQVAAAVAANIQGRPLHDANVNYVFQCISLGRRNGIIQFVHSDDRARPLVLTGRAAAAFKEKVVSGALRHLSNGTRQGQLARLNGAAANCEQ